MTPPHSQVRSLTGPPAASSSLAVTVALPDLFHPFSSSSPSTSPSTWTSFGASAEASSFPPPHTTNLHSFSLSPSQGRHPLRQLRQQRRGRIRRRRRPPVARRRRRRYRPRHPPVVRAGASPGPPSGPPTLPSRPPPPVPSTPGPPAPPVAPLPLPPASLAAADAADGPLACPDRCPYGWMCYNIIMYGRARACAC